MISISDGTAVTTTLESADADKNLVPQGENVDVVVKTRCALGMDCLRSMLRPIKTLVAPSELPTPTESPVLLIESDVIFASGKTTVSPHEFRVPASVMNSIPSEVFVFGHLLLKPKYKAPPKGPSSV